MNKSQSFVIYTVTILLHAASSQYTEIWTETFNDNSNWICGNGGTWNIQWTSSCHIPYSSSSGGCQTGTCGLMCAVSGNTDWWFQRTTTISSYSALYLQIGKIKTYNLNQGEQCQIWYSYDGANYINVLYNTGGSSYYDQPINLGSTGSASILRIKLQIHVLDNININDCNKACYFDNIILSGILTTSPTNNPTTSPTKTPTNNPSIQPTFNPTTNNPTIIPTNHPNISPTQSPSKSPTMFPTTFPTMFPTKSPTIMPTKSPTNIPTITPTKQATNIPTQSTNIPTVTPTKSPVTAHPTFIVYTPTNTPSITGSNPSDTYTSDIVGTSNELMKVEGMTDSMLFIIIIGGGVFFCFCLCLFLLKLRGGQKKMNQTETHINKVVSNSNVMMTNMSSNSPSIASNNDEENGVFGANLMNITGANNLLIDDIVDEMDDTDTGIIIGAVTAGGTELQETDDEDIMNDINVTVGGPIGNNNNNDNNHNGDYLDDNYLDEIENIDESDEMIMNDIDNNVTVGGPIVENINDINVENDMIIEADDDTYVTPNIVNNNENYRNVNGEGIVENNNNNEYEDLDDIENIDNDEMIMNDIVTVGGDTIYD